MSDVNAPIADTQAATGGQGTVRDYFALLKPRVMSLVIFTAFVGIIAAPGTLHPWLAFVALLSIAVGAGAAGALNMWYDADIDRIMRRTRSRPIPAGQVSVAQAAAFLVLQALVGLAFSQTAGFAGTGVSVSW